MNNTKNINGCYSSDKNGKKKKRRFGDAKSALEFAKKMKQYPYICKSCGSYHVTSIKVNKNINEVVDIANEDAIKSLLEFHRIKL